MLLAVRRARETIKWLWDCDNAHKFDIHSHGFWSFRNALRCCLCRFVGHIKDYRITQLLQANRNVRNDNLSGFSAFGVCGIFLNPL